MIPYDLLPPNVQAEIKSIVDENIKQCPEAKVIRKELIIEMVRFYNEEGELPVKSIVTLKSGVNGGDEDDLLP